jgi:hypothetical protein
MVCAHWTFVESEVMSIERVLCTAKTILHTFPSTLVPAVRCGILLKVLLHSHEVFYSLCNVAKSSAMCHIFLDTAQDRAFLYDVHRIYADIS